LPDLCYKFLIADVENFQLAVLAGALRNRLQWILSRSPRYAKLSISLPLGIRRYSGAVFGAVVADRPGQTVTTDSYASIGCSLHFTLRTLAMLPVPDADKDRNNE
jgi:hypothetical protein